ncbi:deoxyribonuclease gamma-like [Protopterus annectens]|uniref:deoxyribonuclease gamma-like n=1 Tax=Protopterus annectens TaxID=7888 RepID=UPI001CFB7074|nr:deoxyribonuclease gamma-like [Protopterus annectens]
MKSTNLTIFLLVLFTVPADVNAFKICAFNIKSFGDAKAANESIMAVLVKILTRCDICLIQEVRDMKGTAISTLMKKLNRFDGSHSYSHIESERLGRNIYKEQYIFIYRADIVQVKDSYQYKKNEKEDSETFCRKPFIVRVYSPTTVIQDFVLVSQHTCPKDAVKEMDELYEVFQEVRGHWQTENVMFLGDFNAACSYVSAKDWKTIRLRNSLDFYWLIGDKEDTTVSEKTCCAYDRIVIHGQEFIQSVIPGSAKPFNFKKEFGLSEEEVLGVVLIADINKDLKC